MRGCATRSHTARERVAFDRRDVRRQSSVRSGCWRPVERRGMPITAPMCVLGQRSCGSASGRFVPSGRPSRPNFTVITSISPPVSRGRSQHARHIRRSSWSVTGPQSSIVYSRTRTNGCPDVSTRRSPVSRAGSSNSGNRQPRPVVSRSISAESPCRRLLQDGRGPRGVHASYRPGEEARAFTTVSDPCATDSLIDTQRPGWRVKQSEEENDKCD